jgi:hypothetical protein
MIRMHRPLVIPANAGPQGAVLVGASWVPTFAGMTMELVHRLCESEHSPRRQEIDHDLVAGPDAQVIE